MKTNTRAALHQPPSRKPAACSTIEMLESRIAPATFLVTTAQDITNGNHTTGSLRDALALADAQLALHPGKVNTIDFQIPAAQMTNGAWDVQLSSLGTLTSKGDVTITGPGAGKLIIDGIGKYEVFNFNNTPGADHPVTISGLSVINGKSTSTYGGGIYSVESLTLKNVVISGSTSAKGAGGVYVTGKYTSAVQANFSNVVITGNTATGLCGGVEFWKLHSFSITNSVVTGNTAGKGTGGIFTDINNTGATGSITGCLVSGNTAAKYGGGVFVRDHNTAATSKTTISKTVITGNTANGTSGIAGGGGLFVYTGNAVLTGVTISNNIAAYAGGGIEASDATSLTITGGSIDGNAVTGGTGGGIDLHTGSAPLTLKGVLVTGNHASGDGGGIYLNTSGAVQITGSTVNFNSVGTASAGGGLASRGTGALDITGGQFSFNTQNGFFVFGGTNVKIQSAQITGNAAVGEGGGAYINATGAVNVLSSIISGNHASSNGGGFCLGGSGVFTLKSDTIANNASGSNGGGIFAGPSLTGSLISSKITGNVAASDGGGVYNEAGGSFTGGSGELALITGNTAPADPNTAGL